jgi:hypothetical protein
MATSGAPPEPAFRGYIETTLDALLVFEACRQGILPMVTRRLHDRERRHVVSGAVFVFDERSAGIRRWTDGRVWSPSRILNNFLVYRELDRRAANSAGGGGGGGDPSDSQRRRRMPSTDSTMEQQPSPAAAGSSPAERARERALVGSLTSSYEFKLGGLVKKTISLAGLHLIGYYRTDDVLQGRLRTPSSLAELAALDIDPVLLVNNHFRVPPRIEMGPDGLPRYRGEPDENSANAASAASSEATYSAAVTALASPSAATDDSGRRQAETSSPRQRFEPYPSPRPASAPYYPHHRHRHHGQAVLLVCEGRPLLTRSLCRVSQQRFEPTVRPEPRSSRQSRLHVFVRPQTSTPTTPTTHRHGTFPNVVRRFQRRGQRRVGANGRTRLAFARLFSSGRCCRVYPSSSRFCLLSYYTPAASPADASVSSWALLYR